LLKAAFLILFLQLIGEFIQKYFEINIPGPVIGLVLLLCFLFLNSPKRNHFKDLRQQVIQTSESLLGYLSLLFVPIGVGVVMHLKLLEGQLLGVIAVIVFGTFATMLFTAVLFHLFNRKDTDE
jgi:holin-like protein